MPAKFGLCLGTCAHVSLVSGGLDHVGKVWIGIAKSSGGKYLKSDCEEYIELGGETGNITNKGEIFLI